MTPPSAYSSPLRRGQRGLPASRPRVHTADLNVPAPEHVAGVVLTGVAKPGARATEVLDFDPFCCVATSSVPRGTKESHRNC